MDLRRSLDEVSAMYVLEPELRDVFVEGWSDKYFVEWYLQKKGIRNVSVYPIEFVDISDEILGKYRLAIGSNRSRVIALSCELTKRRGDNRKVICLIDRDYEDYCPSGHANPYLALTDGNSLELYALTLSVIEKFLLVALGGFPLSARSFIAATGEILGRVFAIRLTNERLRWEMSWIPFTKYIDVSKNSINFRESEFIRSYLQKNNQWGRRKEFVDALSETTRLLSSDISLRIRGHDLAAFTLLLIKKLRKERVYGNSETIEGCLLASIEATDLDSHSVFRRIKSLAQ